jgi:hypothetical protein
MLSFLDIDILNYWDKFDSKARTCKYTRKIGERKEGGWFRCRQNSISLTLRYVCVICLMLKEIL